MRRRVGVSHRGCPLATESERRRRGPRDAPDVRGRARDGRAMASRKPPRTRARGLSLARDIRVRGRRRVTLATPAQRRGPARRFGQGGRARDGDSRGVGRALAAPASVPCYFRAVERPRRASGTSSRASRASATSDVRLAHRSWRRSIFSPRKASQAARFALRFGGTSARAKSDVEAFFHKISLGGGFLARPPVEALAHVDDGSGEIQVLFTPALPSERSLRETPAADARAERVRALALAAADGCTVTVTATDTRARGFVELVSSDPIEPPRVVLGWTEDVVAATSRGVRLARRAMGPAFEMIGGDDDDASRDADVHEEGDEDDTLREYCASLAQCAHSVAGTCRMGPEEDEFAVVDASLRVIGVDGVRVVGEATAPTVHGAHSAALTVAIAERAAAMIREERTAVERDAVRRRLPRVPLETSVARVVDVSAGTDDDKGANANADADSDANANADDARCDSPPAKAPRASRMSNRARLRGGTSSRTRANAKTERLESARERVEGNDEGEGAHRPTDADALLCFVFVRETTTRTRRDRLDLDATRDARGEAWKRHPPVESNFQTLV